MCLHYNFNNLLKFRIRENWNDIAELVTIIDKKLLIYIAK